MALTIILEEKLLMMHRLQLQKDPVSGSIVPLVLEEG